MSVIRQALDLAVRDKLLAESPTVDVPRAEHQKEPPDPFSQAEAEAVLAYMAQHYPPEVHNMAESWFFMGQRTSEIFGLRWPNVDIPGKVAHVLEVVVRGEHKARTKTNSARLVKLNSRSSAAIKRQEEVIRMAGEHV